MSTTTFDTLAAARDLENAGADRTLAEAIAKTVRDGQGNLATKDGAHSLRGELRSLRGELRSGLRTLQWVIGITATLSLATFTAVLFLAARLL